MSNVVRLIAFAGARDLVGAAEVDFPLSGPCGAQDFLSEVCRRYPALAPYQKSLRVAVNGAYAGPDERVSFGDEVALIPPVAGG